MSTATKVEAKRIFRMGAVELPDPDPTMSPEDVLKLYQPNFPHLQAATVEGPEVEGDALVYSFVVHAKTKGQGERVSRPLLTCAA